MYLSVWFSVTFRGEDDELHQLHPRRLFTARCGATTIGRGLPYVTAATPGRPVRGPVPARADRARAPRGHGTPPPGRSARMVQAAPLPVRHPVDLLEHLAEAGRVHESPPSADRGDGAPSAGAVRPGKRRPWSLPHDRQARRRPGRQPPVRVCRCNTPCRCRTTIPRTTTNKRRPGWPCRWTARPREPPGQSWWRPSRAKAMSILPARPGSAPWQPGLASMARC